MPIEAINFALSCKLFPKLIDENLAPSPTKQTLGCDCASFVGGLCWNGL
jgi:hypothetical protein